MLAEDGSYNIYHMEFTNTLDIKNNLVEKVELTYNYPFFNKNSAFISCCSFELVWFVCLCYLRVPFLHSNEYIQTKFLVETLAQTYFTTGERIWQCNAFAGICPPVEKCVPGIQEPFTNNWMGKLDLEIGTLLTPGGITTAVHLRVKSLWTNESHTYYSRGTN